MNAFWPSLYAAGRTTSIISVEAIRPPIRAIAIISLTTVVTTLPLNVIKLSYLPQKSPLEKGDKGGCFQIILNLMTLDCKSEPAQVSEEVTK